MLAVLLIWSGRLLRSCVLRIEGALTGSTVLRLSLDCYGSRLDRWLAFPPSQSLLTTQRSLCTRPLLPSQEVTLPYLVQVGTDTYRSVPRSLPGLKLLARLLYHGYSVAVGIVREYLRASLLVCLLLNCLFVCLLAFSTGSFCVYSKYCAKHLILSTSSWLISPAWVFRKVSSPALRIVLTRKHVGY